MLKTEEVLSFLEKARITKKKLEKTTLTQIPISVEGLTDECDNVIKLCNTIIELEGKLQRNETSN